MQTEKQKIGQFGENTAKKFLLKHNYQIVDSNYRKKWGEIDIVAQKDNILHFIEVKSVTRVTDYLPEENVHNWKKKRLARAIQSYLLEKQISEETEWQIDIIAVFLDLRAKKARIRITKNIIL